MHNEPKQSLIYTVIEGMGLEGFSEPLFNSFDAEECQQWIAARIILRRLESPGWDHSKHQYQMLASAVAVPKELVAYYPGGDREQGLLFTWTPKR